MALGVMAGAVKGPKAELYLQFAERMTWACFQLYNATKTGGAGGKGSLAEPPLCTRLQHGACTPARTLARCSWFMAVLHGRRRPAWPLTSSCHRGSKTCCCSCLLHCCRRHAAAGLGAERIQFLQADSNGVNISVVGHMYWQRPEVRRVLA